MLPVEDPSGPAERGIRPLRLRRAGREPAPAARRDGPRRGLCRLRDRLGRARSRIQSAVRPLVKEIADRGLALIEINPTPARAVHRLTVELGVGYARTPTCSTTNWPAAASRATSTGWSTGRARRAPDKPARHGFGVMQPDDPAIDALLAWCSGAARSGRPLVRADHRPLRMPRRLHDAMRAQPAQLRP